MNNEQLIKIDSKLQLMTCYEQGVFYKHYRISTGKNGLGEQVGSECTPRGWHRVYRIIGQGHQKNSVFVSRQWTGEVYTPELGELWPDRDWILTRIIQIDGLEPGKNQGGDVDSLQRYIYLHGTPDQSILGVPGSRGCIRMNNEDIIELADWVKLDTRLCIE